MKDPQIVLNEIHDFVGLPTYNYSHNILYDDHSPNLHRTERGKHNITTRHNSASSRTSTATATATADEQKQQKQEQLRPLIPLYFRKELYSFYKPLNDQLLHLFLQYDKTNITYNRFYGIWDE